MWKASKLALYSLRKTRDSQDVSTGRVARSGCGKTDTRLSLYTGPAPPWRAQLHPHWTRETDLSAQRASTEAEAWLPAADVVEGRPRHPEAAARARPEAPLRLAGDAPQPCNAATVSPARATSTPSTGKAGRSRRATSSSTGSTGKDDEDGDVRLGIAIPKKIGSAVTRTGSSVVSGELARAHRRRAARDRLRPARPGAARRG